MKRILLVLLLALVALAAVLLVRAARFAPREVRVPAAATFTPLAGAPERLAGAVRIPTVSPADSTQRDSAAFRALHTYLAGAYPRVHAAARVEGVGQDALLFTWPGSDPALRPIVLMGHLDVVPVEPGTEAQWTRPPFSGAIADGFVWGRGTLDDKSTVLGVLEAVEGLLAGGFRPRRTVILAFGADEEVGGERGAVPIAALLRARGVSPELVLDEGGLVVEDAVPGLTAPAALIGVAEKGFASVELTVRGAGGHSSMPPRHTAAGVLARAVTRLEANPFPGEVRGATALLFDAVGREMGFGRRVVFANRWLFDPLIERQLAAAPRTDATLRTTTAVTMLEGGPKDNVLPSRARAVVNFRILPGDSVAGVLAHVRRVVDDTTVQVRLTGTTVEPSPVSPARGHVWEQLERSVRQAYPDAVVAPFLVLGATDARWMRGLTTNVYRFSGMRIDASDLSRVHGTNERIAVDAYLEGIRFFALLIRNTAS